MNMSISYSRQGDVHTIETGGAALPKIVVDNSNLPEDQRGGTAKQLLGSAAVFCYMSALCGALEARGIKYENASATATLDVGSNDLGQGRVKKITIDATVTLSEDDSSAFERVAKILRQGCLITGSLHDGIQMNYNLTPEYKD